MKKRLVLAICCGILILGCLGRCGNQKETAKEYRWPTSTLAKSLPLPESKYGEIVSDAEDSFEINVFKVSQSQFADYMDACKKNGYTVDYYATDDSYDAENKDGNDLSLSYDEKKKTMNIDVYSLSDASDEMEETEEAKETETTENSKSVKKTESTQKENTKKEKKQASEKKDEKVNADFKKMMDSYEAFFDKYIKFMKKYENSDDVAGMLNEYTEYMTEYADYIQKLDEIDTDELSVADAAYYAEVQARIYKKLSEI